MSRRSVPAPRGLGLGGITEKKAAAEVTAQAVVALGTHGAGGLAVPPVEMLRAAGFLLFAGTTTSATSGRPTDDLIERAAGGRAISAATTKSR